MNKYTQPILIVSDDQAELDEVKLHLSSSYSRIYDVLDDELAIHFFEKKRVALLLLCFRSLHRAETFYLKLFRSCESIYEIPHQVIVFVARSELERAYELCRREIFHSFVIVRPLLSEHFLRLAVNQALEKRAAHLVIHRGRSLLKRLAGQFERIRKEFDQLITDSHAVREDQRGVQQSLAKSIDEQLSVFRDGLMGKEMQKIVTVHDSAALNKEFDQLLDKDIAGQLEYYHSKMDERLGGWTSHLEKHISLLEQTSDEVREIQQLQPPKILIIDDDEIQRHMLSSVLLADGYHVETASGGNEGMSMLLTKVPDLVLLDYEMPDLDGVSLLRKARKSSQIKDLPMIMLTGHREKEVVKLCLDHGANGYLVKPVEIERLYEHLDQYFPRPAPKQVMPIVRT
jgi:DNA-binding response OmpR family regulator